MLRWSELRFGLQPLTYLDWPVGHRATILRGALGAILREIACDPLCPTQTSCRFSESCAYSILFAPEAANSATRLRKNVDRPRPFVTVPDLDGPDRLEPGGRLEFSVRLFGSARALSPYFIVVFADLLRRGLGPRRTPCRLMDVSSGEHALFADGAFAMSDRGPVECYAPLDLPTAGVAGAVRVRWLTPTYLKDGGREICRGAAAFGPLVRRARDRISSLYQFYCAGDQSGDLPWDFRGLSEAADRARCLEDQTEWLSQTRRSTRTGQRHELGGLVGSAVFEGVTPELRRLLELAATTHVGKHATFGLGRIAVEDLG